MSVDLCRGILDEWRDQLLALDTPALRGRYAPILASGMQLYRQAESLLDTPGCEAKIEGLYAQISNDLRTATQRESSDGEFPWTPSYRRDIHLSRGLYGISDLVRDMADFIDTEGVRRPDTQLAAAARNALRKYYTLKPVGTETTTDLEDRIVGIFVNRYAANWNQGMSPEDIIGDASLREVVADVSPLSVLKSYAPPIQRLNIVDYLPLLVLAGVGAGFLATQIGKKKKKRRKA